MLLQSSSDFPYFEISKFPTFGHPWTIKGVNKPPVFTAKFWSHSYAPPILRKTLEEPSFLIIVQCADIFP